MDRINQMSKPYNSIGALPSSYLVSLSYEQQLMYLCDKIEEISNLINGKIDVELREYIDERFNDIMLNTMYDAETETLILYLSSSNNGGNS